jgi:hypothetical protein
MLLDAHDRRTRQGRVDGGPRRARRRRHDRPAPLHE